MRPMFEDWMHDIQIRTEQSLSDFLPLSGHSPVLLHQAMRYAALGGGKRVRPLLAHAAGNLTDAPAGLLAVVSSAVEMIHVYSLVHDDLPCMDDDRLRRGRPTCHIQFSEATALLAGDALQTEAFSVLARTPMGNAAHQIEMLKVLSGATGSRGMAGGQAIDLESIGKTLTQPELEHMHAMKTGALIRASIVLGALCGRPMQKDERDHLDHFAKHIGLLFQVIDDILDCTASTATLGKTAGKDAANGKPTYVSLLGLEAARELAESLRIEAMAALTSFGDTANRLCEITDYIARRDY